MNWQNAGIRVKVAFKILEGYVPSCQCSFTGLFIQMPTVGCVNHSWVLRSDGDRQTGDLHSSVFRSYGDRQTGNLSEGPRMTG